MALGLLVIWGVVWVLALSVDQCAAEDELECTTAGWLLLGAWAGLPVVIILLLVVAAIRAARSRR